jgi:hypothetical protein
VNTRTDAIAYWMSQGKTRDEAKVLTFGCEAAMTAASAPTSPPDPNLEHLGACRVADPAVPAAAGRVLLVGEDNPLSSWPENALVCWPDGCAGERLQSRIFGLPELEYLALWRTNLCRGGWFAKSARARATELLNPDAPWKVIVMLGRKVEAAFRPHTKELIAAFNLFLEVPGHFLVSLPHPSRRNARTWTAGAIGNARQIMRELAPELGWGSV